MNDLLEMLQTKEKLDELIQEAVRDLTVNEFNYLQENGILTEIKITKDNIINTKKLIRKIGVSTGFLKPKPAELAQKLNKRVKTLDGYGIDLDPEEGFEGMKNLDYMRAMLNWNKKAVRKDIGLERAAKVIGTSSVPAAIAGKSIQNKRRDSAAAKAEANKPELQKIREKIKTKVDDIIYS